MTEFSLSYGDFNVFKMADDRHLQFSKFVVCSLCEVTSVACYFAFLCKISLKSDNQLLS